MCRQPCLQEGFSKQPGRAVNSLGGWQGCHSETSNPPYIQTWSPEWHLPGLPTNLSSNQAAGPHHPDQILPFYNHGQHLDTMTRV